MADMQWKKPRKVTIVVDNDSWILPYVARLADQINRGGDHVKIARAHDDVGAGHVAFYLGCMRITPQDILDRNHKNIVVHASDLPKGRGFAPVAWQILEGKSDIPVCLLEMAAEVDAGPVVFREKIHLDGDELYSEWRDILGQKIVDMCLCYLESESPPQGVEQQGEPTFYKRRRPKDSELDPTKSIEDQFNLLRVVDNENYPAFFTLHGKTYKLKISKVEE